jgi:hypothetical protein
MAERRRALPSPTTEMEEEQAYQKMDRSVLTVGAGPAGGWIVPTTTVPDRSGHEMTKRT